jgi:RNA polymerase sigma factor (TIGR02999 family)
MATPEEVTQMLIDWSNGDQTALDKLIPVVYTELRKLADKRLRRRRPDYTIQTTALVHEAYIHLIDCNNIDWKNRAHFFGVAAQLMRNVLVDYARKQASSKRGGGMYRLTLDDSLKISDEQDVDLMALDEALLKLEDFDPQKNRIIEMRYFAGLTIEETAEALGISATTVKREWSFAKAWLHREIKRR